MCSANLQLWPSCLLYIFFKHLLEEWSSKSPTITEKSIPASASFVRSGTWPQSVRLNYRDCGCQQGLKQIDLPLLIDKRLRSIWVSLFLLPPPGMEKHQPFCWKASYGALAVFTCSLHIRCEIALICGIKKVNKQFDKYKRLGHCLANEC